ncbi:hypothetical protein [Collimonas sp. PA-H2]|uniref:hypothetical protein n=1 Tax=Collimonas sp. PA-H2 TaxID=1881062 RepID=UPI00118023C6|nr:hypothetical protein [Collimonas sp. PA-H2]
MSGATEFEQGDNMYRYVSKSNEYFQMRICATLQGMRRGTREFAEEVLTKPAGRYPGWQKMEKFLRTAHLLHDQAV